MSTHKEYEEWKNDPVLQQELLSLAPLEQQRQRKWR